MSKKLRTKSIYFEDETSLIVEDYMKHNDIKTVSKAVNHIFKTKGKLSRAEIIQNHLRSK